jgi:acetylglutamate synthase
MKTKQLLIAIAALTVAVTTTFITGCQSSGYDAGNKTAADIQAAADRIAAGPAQIDAVLASLNDMVDKPQADLRPQYQLFADNVAKVEAAAKAIAANRKSMGERQKEFFAKWDEQLAQIKNEDIKARSQSRKDEVNKNLLAIKTSYLEAATAFKPFMANLKDVQKYLSVDLTTGGIAAIKDTVTKVNESAVPLKTSIAKVAEDFKALGVSMSSVAPQQQVAPATAAPAK